MMYENMPFTELRAELNKLQTLKDNIYTKGFISRQDRAELEAIKVTISMVREAFKKKKKQKRKQITEEKVRYRELSRQRAIENGANMPFLKLRELLEL